MGNDEGGAPLTEPVKGALNLRLGHCIQRRGGFIQNQHRRIFQENAGNGHALLLPAGQQRAPLAHIGIKPLRHTADVLVNFRLPGGLLHLLVGGIGTAVADIFPDGIGKEEHILLHHADGTAQAVLTDTPHIHAV